jgi:hypothetical protein
MPSADAAGLRHLSATRLLARRSGVAGKRKTTDAEVILRILYVVADLTEHREMVLQRNQPREVGRPVVDRATPAAATLKIAAHAGMQRKVMLAECAGRLFQFRTSRMPSTVFRRQVR